VSHSAESDQPARALEQLISDVAEFKKNEDLQLLYHQLLGRQVFLPIVAMSAVPQGVKVITGPQDRISIRMAVGPNQKRCIYAVTHESHPLLKDGFVEMDWTEALQMTLRLGDDLGVLLQGAKSWIILDCQTVNHVLQHYGKAQ
jgi:hypothetical protein